MSPDELQQLNQETVRRNNAVLAQEAQMRGGNYSPQITPLDAWEAKRVDEMNSPAYLAKQAKQEELAKSKLLGELMLANTKDGKLNAGGLIQQGLANKLDANSLMDMLKLFQADKELQTKGSLVSPDAQLKADTDIKVAELVNAGKSKQELRENLKDVRETAKQTSTQYSSDTANFINSTRKALINDVEGTDRFENALSNVLLENNKTIPDLLKEDPLGMFYNPKMSPLGLAYHAFKNKEPSPSQIQKQMLASVKK